MRYAIVSDIHANLHAWNATLLDIRSDGVDAIVCLGDIIGYGPQPAAVLESAYTNIDRFVLGNHDAALCGKLDPDGFNDDARTALDWTRSQLNDDALRFLDTLPLTLDGGIFRCAHSEFGEPGAYHYVIEPEDAAPSWCAVDEPLLFVGHTHDPAIFILGPSGVPRKVGPQDFLLEEGKRFLVSVGSVGQPRDGDARACYCIFDSDRQAVYWRRVPFDLDAYRQSLEKAGLPSGPSAFLRYDPRTDIPPLRELLNFSPPMDESGGVRNAVLVADITDLRKRVARWRTIAAAVCIGSLVAASAAGIAMYRHANRTLVMDGIESSEPASPAQPGVNLLVWPPSRTDFDSAPRGWKICLGDGRSQRMAFEDSGGEATWRISSSTDRDDIRLVSRRIAACAGEKYCVEGLFRKEDDFSGNVALAVCVARGPGENPLEQFIVKEPVLPRREGWLAARQTFIVPARATAIWCEIRGRFAGTTLVRGLSLVRQDARP